MKIELHWRKPLLYLLLPILLVLAFVGFPPPFAPARTHRAAQEQSEPSREAERP